MNEKKTVSVSFMLLGILFCVCLISANLLATKQIMYGPLNITAAIIVFPISYIINDCIAEVWGFKRARLIIWTGFVMNFIFVLFGALADWIPGAPYWNNEEGFRRDVETIHLMGFDGKSIINPRQIRIVHEIFTPDERDIIFAEKVVREIDAKKAQGIGVFTVDGKMIDIAFYDGAKRTIALAKASGVYKGDL